jgi:hypothetical protein
LITYLAGRKQFSALEFPAIAIFTKLSISVLKNSSSPCGHHSFELQAIAFSPCHFELLPPFGAKIGTLRLCPKILDLAENIS